MNKFNTIGCCAFLFYCSAGFAENYTQAVLIDSETGVQTITYQNKEGLAVVEDDIVIGTMEELQRKGSLVHTLLNKRWPNAVLPYKINDAMPNANRTYIHQAIDHIEDTTNVRFVLVTDQNKSQYEDYVEFIPSPSSCSSYVGRQGGRQTISLAKNCLRGQSIHEICHALGFWHEQSRSDRDSYVKINWDNITEASKGNFNMVITNGFRMGGYDYGSIMHYGSKDFSKNGKETIVPLKAGIEIGQRKGLSPIDIDTMNKIYKK